MVNKLTIETAYKQDPYKSYYVILNPRIDSKTKKVNGLAIKSVEYCIKDWDTKEIRFEKVNKMRDKRFPNIICFDKRFPDAENEVYADRVSTAKKKPKKIDSYGIFIDAEMAEYNKLIRLHRLAEDMSGIYTALKSKENKKNEVTPTNETDGVKPTDSGADSKGAVVDKEAIKDIEEGISADKISLSSEEVKNYFLAIQDTNYFDKLEEIQANNPSLATR
jgi:hypothetical protein